jgi:hypothetical protein
MNGEERETMKEKRQSCPCAYPFKPHAIKEYGRSGSIYPRIFDLRTSLRWIVSFRPRPLYPRGKSYLHTLNRSLVRPHNGYGRSGENKNLVPAETRASNPWQFSPYPVAITTALSQLPVLLQLGNYILPHCAFNCSLKNSPVQNFFTRQIWWLLNYVATEHVRNF